MNSRFKKGTTSRTGNQEMVPGLRNIRWNRNHVLHFCLFYEITWQSFLNQRDQNFFIFYCCFYSYFNIWLTNKTFKLLIWLTHCYVNTVLWPCKNKQKCAALTNQYLWFIIHYWQLSVSESHCTRSVTVRLHYFIKVHSINLSVPDFRAILCEIISCNKI